MHQLSFPVLRMFAVMDYVVGAGINGVSSETAFLHSIGFASATNLPKIKSGAQSFRMEHYTKAVEAYGVDGNFFLKETHTKMFSGAKTRSLLDEYNDLGVRLRLELKKKTRC